MCALLAVSSLMAHAGSWLLDSYGTWLTAVSCFSQWK